MREKDSKRKREREKERQNSKLTATAQSPQTTQSPISIPGVAGIVLV